MTDAKIRFTFDGREYLAEEGDTVAAALYRNGIKVLTRSIKFHRPRGLYCGTGDCPNCLVNVDGVPNVRSCATRVSEGMAVRSQNRVLSLRHDPAIVMDRVFTKGFNYHHRFIRPAFARGMYQWIIRRMAGIGEVPNVDVKAEPTRRMKTDVLVIGDGAAAVRAAEKCASAGTRTVLVAERTERPTSALPSLNVMTGASVIGAYDDGSVLASYGGRLNIFEPYSVILSERGRVQPIIFANWDLPGILSESAALELIESRISLGKRVLVVGEPTRREKVVRLLLDSGMEKDQIISIESEWRVLAAVGKRSVSSAVISDGKARKKVACDCIVTCGPLAPRTEIARQLGCAVDFAGKEAPRIAVDDSFETSKRNVFAIGESARILDETEGIRSAEAAAYCIISRRARR